MTRLLFFVLLFIINHIQGDNISPPDVNTVGIPAVKQWASDRNTGAKNAFQQGGNQYTPSLPYWGGEIVYSIQVDRFNDGDISNNDKNLPPMQVQNQNTSHPYGLPQYRHGGDLQGIIDRLEYIQELGATVLWVTPILKHNGDYHGYCTTDPTIIDPGFGDQDLFRRMVQEAHKLGIYVVMDIVVNHLCDRQTTYSQAPDHANCANELNDKNWSGTSGGSLKQGSLNFGPDFFPPLKSEYFFNRCGPNSDEDMRGEGPAAVFGDFVEGMYDYDTRNYDFQDIFTLLHSYWIAYADIDGFRLDAAKHITEDFVAAFSTNTRAFAKSLGKDNFYIVGEVAADAQWEGRRLGRMFSNPSNPDQHGSVPLTLTNRIKTLEKTYSNDRVNDFPGLSAIYGFDESGTSRDILLNNKSPLELQNFYTGPDFATIASQNDPRLSWVLLEIHDWVRFSKANPNDPFKSAVGLAFVATLPGMPIIYYGQEQGFNGVCGTEIDAHDASQSIRDTCNTGDDSLSRQDMFVTGPWRLGSTVDVINPLGGIGVGLNISFQKWQDDPFLRRDTQVFKTSQRANLIRKSCGPLKYGAIYFRRVDSEIGGLFSFSRIDADMEVVVIVNPTSFTKSISNILIDSNINKVSGQKYINLLNTSQVAYVGVTNGVASIYFNNQGIDGNSVMIMVHENNVGPFETDIGTALCKVKPTQFLLRGSTSSSMY